MFPLKQEKTTGTTEMLRFMGGIFVGVQSVVAVGDAGADYNRKINKIV